METVELETAPGDSSVKFAQAMRVLLERWKTTERLPKYEGSPGRVAR